MQKYILGYHTKEDRWTEKYATVEACDEACAIKKAAHVISDLKSVEVKHILTYEIGDVTEWSGC
jgi:hypothetical protein